MPAKSKKQQMAAGAALSAKRGETSRKSLKGASRSMAESMSETQLEKFAATKRKKLPTKKTARSGGNSRQTTAGKASKAKSKSNAGKQKTGGRKTKR